MRPLELTVRGFRSYAAETTFRFSDRSLVGIVGPIGSGKSSILDAVAFGLFGKTPRIERDTKSLINQRRDSLHVALAFEVDGERFRVVRALRRSGASAHTLYRITEDGDEEIADRARDVSTGIESLLGMDFEAFQRSVLLAQNQFSRFLDATPTERGKVLKGVFGFDRLDAMREVARSRLDVIKAELHGLSTLRASEEQSRKELADKRTDLERAESRSEALGALRVSVGQVDDTLREAEGRLRTATEAAAALDRLVEQIPAREATEGIFAAARSAGDEVETAEAAAVQAADALTAASAALAEAEDSVGGREALVATGDLVTRSIAIRRSVASEQQRLADTRAVAEAAAEAVTAAREDLAAATREAGDAKTSLAEAVEAERTAQEALHQAHAADSAAMLRSELVVGDACPVCEQVIATLPDPGGSGATAEAEQSVASASALVAERRTAEGVAAAAMARAGAEVKAAEGRLDEAEKAVSATQVKTAAAEKELDELLAEIADGLGQGDPEELLTAMRRRVAEAEEALRAAQAADAEARRRASAAAGRRAESGRAVDKLRTSLATLAGRLDVDLAIGESPDEVEVGLKEVREHWVALRGDATNRVEEAERAVVAGGQARADLLEGAGLAATDDIVEVATEATREATALGAEVGVLEKQLERLSALGEEESTLVAQRDLLERLHGDLAPSRFLEFVLDDRRKILADLAGTHLETLTAGRYRFSEDGAFDLLDLAAAEAVRAPASLSGGESFLASLALALALAEIVSREGGRLDSFFLDEGFGSLDPEHLDLAMDGVERLVASGGDRLVVIVSHVPALRERLEDLIVLDRDAVTGDTIVRSGEA